jgi:hypothetical protein
MKEIKRIFTEQLSSLGFSKQSNDWVYNNEELIIVINLQKSSYEKLYFLNIGIWLNEISNTCKYPKENICHIRIRAERLFTSIPQALNPRELFDFNDAISEEKINSIAIFLKDYLSLAINKMKSVDSLKKLYKEDSFSQAYLEKNARAILSL